MTQQFHSEYIPKRTKNRCWNQNLYKNVHRSTPHSGQNLEKGGDTHPHNEMLFNNKKSWCIDTYDMDESWNHCAKWNNPDTKVTSGIIPFIQNMQNRQIIETVDLVAAGDCGGGEWGVTA